ncbi:UPF0182 family protein [Gordonia sp. w5E2]|uniref:UPF0182 protein ABW18_11060 n=2 Tax=Gordonia TaxID=2053 RepID=A0ABR5IDL5_9ACTN|nr:MULTISPECIES: UPF0182 family protein [Gordonia]KNA91677.1 hypothetical protein ABW18_11060 [Gordonia jacobaea]OBC05882.1 hypothetical protein A5786_10760 [Gordonia sp. 852002-50816_SCH5313054-a]OBC21135.1 hypothetical protein A5788_04555 [Gordonia sp. 852002-50816_SCH5313054-c]
MGVRGPAGMPTLSRRSKIAIGVGVAILVVLLVGPRLVSIITDWLWMSDVGYTEVFSTIVWTRIALFLIVGVLAGGLIFGAVALAYRSRPVFVPASGPNDPLARYRASIMGHIRWYAIIPPILIGLIFALVAQGSWATVQTFLHGTEFGQRDAQFGLDVGFYAFDLPFYRFVLNILFVVVVISFFASLITHYLFGGIRLGGGGNSITNAARIQLAVLAGTFLVLKAVSYWFDRYSLLSSQRKQEIFTGASYTDINAVLPSKLILMVVAIICAVAFFAGAVMRDLRVPALATVLMLFTALVMGVGWPLAMEQFSVKPNAAQKELEYIQRNMDATKQAYGLVDGTNVEYQRNWTQQPADPVAVNNDSATLSNIRVLDPNVIEPAFTQRQKLKNFYGFPTQLAVDRYTVDGQQRDFIVAARELDPSKFDANQQNWINKHTVFTHGNGFIAAQANTVDEASSDAESDRGGLPVFAVSDLENYQTEDYKANAPIKVSQPRIYFGELIAKVDPDYAIVGSTEGDREYDLDGKNYTYSADSGVSLGNWFNRILYSVKYTERNILLSNAINSNSKIIYNRDPRDRVKKVAPWLTVDSKTYPSVMADGSIKWIVDGYTTLATYPYAQKTSLQDATTDAQELNRGQTGRTQVNKQVSYVRNSVKATVDAYTGKVTLYEVDQNDPVLKTWMKVFPGTVKPRSDFDKQEDLKQHVRYPEDLFKIQRALLSRYHVSDPGTFFRSNDFWSIPNDPTKDDATQQGLSQPPYYFTAASPRGPQAEFQLTTVMNGFNSRFLSAYMTASSDPDDYGKITVKTLPTTKQTVGPQQAQENMKSAGPVASDRKQVEDTTKVTYGNLLTLPVGQNGVLYMEPMYTQSKTDDSAIPKLYRVLVYFNAASDEARVGYAATVAEALKQVGISPAQATTPENGPVDVGNDGQQPIAQPTQPTQQGPSSPQREAAVKEIGAALGQLKDAQTKGDFTAYGEALDRLNKAVQQYESLPAGN